MRHPDLITEPDRWRRTRLPPSNASITSSAQALTRTQSALHDTPMRSFFRKFFSPRWKLSSASAESSSSAHEMSGTGTSSHACSPGSNGPHLLGDRRGRQWRGSNGSELGGALKCVVVDNDLDAYDYKLLAGDEAKVEIAEVIKSDAESEVIPGALPPQARDEEAALGSPPRSDKSSEQSHRSFRQHLWTRFLTDSLWPFLKSFGHMTFPDREQERLFQLERWHTSKPGACAGAFFLLLGTLLSIGFTKRWTTWNYYAYIGIAGSFNFSLPFLILFNTYYRAHWVYQVILMGATWCWPFILAIEVHTCGFFMATNTCGGRTFLNFFALLAGVPTFGLMTLLLNRVLHLLGITAWLVMMLLLFVNDPKADMPMWRNVILAVLYHYIFVWAAFFRERADRQLFTLRSQLKAQYRAVQSAQEMERSAHDSKKRFVSYIFHEVRVPLNTARLALSNLDAEGAFGTLRTDQGELIVGLDVSLRMMEKVLNDVLSFNRMESGNLILTRKPFILHQAMHHVSLAYRATAESSGLSFTLELDPRIDELGGTFVGDEMRFKQMCTNLVSNAFKFTESGGVKVVTKLLRPAPQACTACGNESHSTILCEKMESASLSSTEKPHIVDMTPVPPTAVIRVEVHDTGAGLSLSDVRDNRLFSPYVQTELGRRQGGKGTGLGLALVTQLVNLHHGRLGVDSEAGKGSVFWFELPYTVVNTHEITSPISPAFPLESPPIMTGAHATLQNVLDEFTREATAPGLPLSPRSPSRLSDAEPQSRRVISRQSRIAHHTEMSRIPASPTLGTSSEPEPPLSTLVVDDDPLTRHLMARMLLRMGHTVQIADDGVAALEILTRAWHGGPPIDIVFLDNQMPGLSGVEVVRAVRALPSNVYVVGCTGNALREDTEKYLSAGADAIVPKPVSQTALLDHMHEVRLRIAQRARYFR